MVLRQQLQEIGIKIKVILYNDEGMLTEEFLSQGRPQAHLKLFLAGTDPEEGIEYWRPIESKRDSKLWIYRNEEVERFIELGEVTQDKKERKEIYQSVHRLIYQDQPACFFYFPFVFHAISGKFDNIDDFFTLSMPFYKIKDWHIKKEVESRE